MLRRNIRKARLCSKGRMQSSLAACAENALGGDHSPSVVSLSNHAYRREASFDRLRTNGLLLFPEH
jgi:hypothetical protein